METTRKTPAAPCILAALLALVTGPATASPATEAFERLKTLEGEWVAASDGPMTRKGDLVSRYRVTAAGTAVIETHFPGTDHEMVTVYYPEGDSLVLDHFCMEGNQPRMRARAFDGPTIRFTFDGGGNIHDPDRERHMHSAWIEIVGDDEIRSEWTELENGEPVLVVPSHLVRAR